MFWIMYHLLSGTKRFGELQRLLPGVSRQVLMLQLRELEQMGVLHRQASVQGSPKVEYSLTELGQKSEPMFRQLYAWGRWTCDQFGLEYDWPVSDEAEARIC
jgi:DNA-binding HxlR family transcriptional regulator